MELLVALRTGDPAIFLGPFLGTLRKNPKFALRVIETLRAPDNLIIRNSKLICRFLLFVVSIEYPNEYEKFIDHYFLKACWNDALHIYRFRILSGRSNDYYPELELLAKELLNEEARNTNQEDNDSHRKTTRSVCPAGNGTRSVLAAKWAPSEKSIWNDEPLFIANILMRLTNKNPKEYRQMLSSLRKDLFETMLSQKRYDEIAVEDIPLTALQRHRKALGAINCEEPSEERMDLRNRYLSNVRVRSEDPIKLEGVCVLDNYVDCKEAYDFVSLVSSSTRGYWKRRIVNMGEFPNDLEIPEGGDISQIVGSMMFGAGVLVLDKVYELILGKCLLWGAEVPRIVYIVTNTPLRKCPNMDNVRNLYKTHGKKVPMSIYVNMGSGRPVRESFDTVCQVHGIGEVTLGLAYASLMDENYEIENVTTTYENIEEYVKLFYW